MGSLAIGPAQYNLPLDKGQDLIREALSLGVNFFDTSEFYGTYPYLRPLSSLDAVVISSRSYASTKEEMRKSVDRARQELDRDIIEIFGLHEQESGLTLKGHMGALEYLVQAKEKGIVKAVSVSTHYVACVKAAAMVSEIDVIFALINIDGLGIADGSRKDMEQALKFARYMGKGIYIMKALGGGHLHKKALEALSWARDFPYKDSVAVGVKNRYELKFAAKVLSAEATQREIESLERMLSQDKKRLIVEDWCQGCGECERKCSFSAIRIIDGKAHVDQEKCVLCGYCARVCPHFCLKVV